jgi:anti-sigma factor RsiW
VSCETPGTLRAFATGSLDEAAAERVAEHLEGCPACAASVESASGDWGAVRAAYRPRRASEALRSRVTWTTRAPVRRAWPRRAQGALVALAACVAVVVAAAVLQRAAPSPPRLDELAVHAHQAYLTQATPLDLRTEDPTALAAELSRRLAFTLRLPPLLGSAGLTLSGARLVQVGGALAAMLVYRQGADVLSLTVAPRAAVALGQGAVEAFGGIDFHFSELEGRYVVQWSEGNLSYALVSSAPPRTETSCGLCHAPGSGLSNVDAFHRPQVGTAGPR